MTESVDPKLFSALSAKSGKVRELPPLCTYNSSDDCYDLKAWGSDYHIFPTEGIITPSNTAHGGYDYFHIFLIHYLLAEVPASCTGEWISEKDLTGGVTFFRGPHEIPTRLITEKFGNDLRLLEERCKRLGGTRLNMADDSYCFDVAGPVKLALLYWQGDEDFPPEAKLLLDSSLSGIFNLDVIYALLCDACVRISSI